MQLLSRLRFTPLAESELTPEQAKERFQAILQKTRGKGKYDCLIPLSGGKDSSYILYVLVKEYDLKPLAFNFNIVFQHSQAMQKIENLVNRLGSAHVASAFPSVSCESRRVLPPLQNAY
jgi:tRNA(Ile)-lysidine synthase TilS/MesJ